MEIERTERTVKLDDIEFNVKLNAVELAYLVVVVGVNGDNEDNVLIEENEIGFKKEVTERLIEAVETGEYDRMFTEMHDALEHENIL